MRGNTSSSCMPARSSKRSRLRIRHAAFGHSHACLCEALRHHRPAGSIIEDPRVRGVTLTGSEKAGATVAEHAARNLKKSVQELRSSHALIVLERALLAATLKNAMVGEMNDAGQSFVATKRMIVVGDERSKLFWRP